MFEKISNMTKFYCPNKSIYYFFKINNKISTSFRRSLLISFWIDVPGTDSGGGRTLKLEKIWFFGVKSWFFTRNTQQFSRLPPLGAIFLSAPPNLKSWIRPWNIHHTVSIWQFLFNILIFSIPIYFSIKFFNATFLFL